MRRLASPRAWVSLLALAGLACLGVGLAAPMLSLEKFYLWENRFSLLEGLIRLTQEGRWPLAVLLSLFSVVLPLAKLLALLRLGIGAPAGEGAQRFLALMHRYGRWSMLDVFVVAVLVAAVKLGALASVQLHYGFYLFALAVLITLITTSLAVRMLERAPA